MGYNNVNGKIFETLKASFTSGVGNLFGQVNKFTKTTSDMPTTNEDELAALALDADYTQTEGITEEDIQNARAKVENTETNFKLSDEARKNAVELSEAASIELDSANLQLTRVEKEIATVNTKIENLKNSDNTDKKQKEKIADEISNLMNELQNLNENKKEAQNNINEKKQKVNEANLAVKDAHDAYAKTYAEYHTANKELAELESQKQEQVVQEQGGDGSYQAVQTDAPICTGYMVRDAEGNTITCELTYDSITAQNIEENVTKESKDGSSITYTNYLNNTLCNETTVLYDEFNTKTNELEVIYENGMPSKTINTKYDRFGRSQKTSTTTFMYGEDGVLTKDVQEQHFYNETIPVEDTILGELDKDMGTFSQGKVGDCWILATLNSLNNTKAGAKILDEAVKVNDDYTCTVNFKGLNTSVTISDKELEKAKESGIYSTGDTDVLLFEVAVEKVLNMAQNGEIEAPEVFKVKEDGEKSITGGFMNKMFYLLTGENAINDFNVKYGETNPILNTVLSGCEALWGTGLENMYKKFEENPDNVCACLNFYGYNESGKDKGVVAKDVNGNDVVLAKTSNGHMWSVKSVDGDNVTIINPWNQGEEVVMSKKELEKYVYDFGYYVFDTE